MVAFIYAFWPMVLGPRDRIVNSSQPVEITMTITVGSNSPNVFEAGLAVIAHGDAPKPDDAELAKQHVHGTRLR